jgi:hypothetical protein
MKIYKGPCARIDWLTHYNGVRLCLRTAATNGPIVHPPGDMRALIAMEVIMPAGENYWLVHQSSLAVLPADTSGRSRRNGRRSEKFDQQYLKHLKGSLTCRKILRNGTSGFTSHRKESVLPIFITLKNPSHWSSLNPWPLGTVASTLTTTPTRRLCVRKLLRGGSVKFMRSVFTQSCDFCMEYLISVPKSTQNPVIIQGL